MQILLLGPVEASSHDRAIALGAPKERALLAMLALHPETVVSAEDLIDGLWGGDPPASAAKLVQQYVSHLRKALAAHDAGEVIVTHGRGYELRVGREHVDAGRFERLLAQGAARDALELWRGSPLADVASEPFAASEVRRLEELRTAALELAIDQDLQSGRHREVLHEIEALLAREPLRERLHAQRMLALYRSGRQAEALEAYREARAMLVEEVGIEPGPELRSLQERILRQDPSLQPPVDDRAWAAPEPPTREQAVQRVSDAVARASSGRAGWRVAEDDLAAGVVELQVLREREALAAGPASDVCPFKGLESFDIADADRFFGRERLIADLVARVPGTRLMGIVGPSGSGKSSTLRAGLLAALAEGVLPGSAERPQLVMRPGQHPVQELRRALASVQPDAPCVLAVDQFEEVFTACDDERERAQFVDELLRFARDTRRSTLALIAIRADFYGHCAAFPKLSRALGADQVLVGPMHRDELRRAIELPARRGGVTVEPELADALVADVEAEPGGLPLLSTALVELWQHRDDARLSLEAYQRSGGVRGAVARLAEGVYGRLDAAGRAQARRVLLRLAGDGDVRVRVPIEDLAEEREVLERLAAERLVTLGDGEAEIAHEALLREWPRLGAWLEEDAEGRRLHRHLTAAARDWRHADRDPAELYRGSRLAAALDYDQAHGTELNASEHEFLEASRAAADQAAERSRRSNRRLRALLAGAAGLIVLAVAAGAVAVSQRGEARDAAIAADAQRLGAEALTNERLDRALLLARAGTQLDPSPAAQSHLLSVLLRHPAALGERRGDGWQLYSVAASDDGTLVAVGDERGSVIVYDERSNDRASRAFRATEGLIGHLAFSPDAAVLAVTTHGNDGITRLDLVDPRTGTRRRRVELPRFPAEVGFILAPIVFTPDGRYAIVEASDVDFAEGATSVLHRVEVRTGRVERSRTIGTRGSYSLSATADRRRLFVTSPGDDRTYEVDPSTLAVRRSWPVGGHAGAVTPDGRAFALGSSSGSIRMLDLRTGRTRTFEGSVSDGSDQHMAFAPDGQTLVTADGTGEVLVWDVTDGRVRERLSSHTEEVHGISVSRDGRTLYTAGVDAKVVTWDLAGDRRIDRRFDAGPTMDFDNGSPKGLAASPDGRTVAITQQDGRVDLVDTTTLDVRRSAQVLDGAALAASFSPDGRLLAVTGEGNRVLLRDARTLAPVRELRGLPDGFSQAVEFSPDGRRVAAAGLTPTENGSGMLGRIDLWDVRTGSPVWRSRPIGVVDLAFSPDGRRLAAAVLEAPSLILSAADGRTVARVDVGDDVRSVAFSPDGRLFALGQYGGRAQLFSTRDWKPSGRPLEAHRARITALEFSSDGQRVLTGGADGTLHLWDTRLRRLIGGAVRFDPDAYVAATFARGDSRIIGVPHLGPGLGWDLRPAAWERQACLVAGRGMTESEWRDALPERPFQRVCAAP